MERTGSKLTNLTDAELVGLALEQNQAAYIVLYTRYNTGVRAHIARYVSLQEDIEDICLESFQKAFSQIATYNPEYKFSTWLYRIATNETINFLKSKRLRTMLSMSGHESSIADRLASDPYFTGDEISRRLYQAISKLPPRQKMIFNMRYFDELKFTEIAEILNRSVGAVKASYHHAFTKMQDILNEND